MHTNSPDENRPMNNGLIDFSSPDLQQALMAQAMMIPGGNGMMMANNNMMMHNPMVMMHPMQLQQQNITPNQILAGQQQAQYCMPNQAMIATPCVNGMQMPGMQQSAIVGPPAYVEVNGTRYFSEPHPAETGAEMITEADITNRAKEQTRALMERKASEKKPDTRAQLVEMNKRMRQAIGAC